MNKYTKPTQYKIDFIKAMDKYLGMYVRAGEIGTPSDPFFVDFLNMKPLQLCGRTPLPDDKEILVNMLGKYKRTALCRTLQRMRWVKVEYYNLEQLFLEYAGIDYIEYIPFPDSIPRVEILVPEFMWRNVKQKNFYILKK